MVFRSSSTLAHGDDGAVALCDCREARCIGAARLSYVNGRDGDVHRDWARGACPKTSGRSGDGLDDTTDGWCCVTKCMLSLIVSGITLGKTSKKIDKNPIKHKWVALFNYITLNFMRVTDSHEIKRTTLTQSGPRKSPHCR